MGKKRPETGLFLCRCRTNIANFVDMDELSNWAMKKEDLVFVETHDLLCSPEGKRFVEKKLAESKVNNIIIAACSPKMHGKTFLTVAEKSGINMAKIHMANIREQAAWVTRDKRAATIKSRALINAAIKRSAYHEDLQQNYVECNTDIAVVGGGLAGIEAALIAANAGRKVTIIEKDISLGGNLIKIEDVAPSLECSACVLAPRLSAIKEHPHVTVVTDAQITDVLGFFGNFTIRVRRRARFVTNACIGCGECFTSCPVSVKSDFDLGLSTRKAIYTAFPGSVPAYAAIDKDNCRHFGNGDCDACAETCPFQAIDYNQQDEEVELKCGAVVVATGCHSFDPSPLENLGYARIDNVYTMPEYERIVSSNGPYGGEIRLNNGETPSSMAVIHCAGSLNDKGVPYCSGICCLTADKAGEMLRKHNPEATIYNIHDRLVYPGPEAQVFHQKQIDKGTRFIRVKEPFSVSVSKDNGKIKITAKDLEAIHVDMVVLSTGIIPSTGTSELAKTFNIDLGESGFYKTDNPILHSTGSSIDGINLAGSCISPCDAGTAVTRAQAASGDVLSRLIPGKKIALEVMTAVVDADICAGCKMCMTVCPYKAITFDEANQVSRVNEVICRGCGTCAATCPSGAVTAKHFTNEQIYAEIEGLIHE